MVEFGLSVVFSIFLSVFRKSFLQIAKTEPNFSFTLRIDCTACHYKTCMFAKIGTCCWNL